MAMSLEEAKKKLNQDLAKKRKGYLSENAYRQSPEGIKKGKENLISMLEYTPAAIPIEGYRAYDNIKKGNYLDAAIDAGVGIGMGVAPLAVAPIAKLGNKAYKGIKNIFSGPLSPQYNSEGGSIYAADGINPKNLFKQKAKEIINRLLGDKKVSPKERAELEELAAFREEMKIDYPDSDVTFHRSLSPNLKISGAKDDPNAFKYKTINVPNKAGFNQGQGIFTFGLEDTAKFGSFGPHIYGGVYPKNARVFSGRMDTESDKNEIFIRENDLEDLIKVK